MRLSEFRTQNYKIIDHTGWVVAVRRIDARTCWVWAPRGVRLPPPQALRVTIAGRSACSAGQLVASSVGSKRKLKTASNSIVRCVAEGNARCLSASVCRGGQRADQQSADPLNRYDNSWWIFVV
jgi:hypothetical protein